MDSFQPGSLDAYDPSMGFPAQYLPLVVSQPSSIPADLHNLTLPFVFPGNADYQAVTAYGFTDTPRPFELAASLATNVYLYWRSTVERPIRSRLDFRQEPFTRFLYTVQPSLLLETSFTPLKLGLTCCGFFYHFINAQDWPGHMTARIRATTGPGTQKLEIGSMKMDNPPQDGTAPAAGNTTGVPGHSGKGLSVPFSTIERRWLECFTKVLFFVTRHPPLSKVTAEPTMSPKERTVRYQFPSGRGDTLDMATYPAANDLLTWDTLLKGMVRWLKGAAIDEGGYKRSELVTDGGTAARLAILLTRLNRISGDQPSDVAATA
ncbi:MAG: hypothetical protein Q9166_007613 [cf. Caloplaca sp. 2 TL-2023]